MSIFVYTHRVDCDGMCSAAILKRYISKKKSEGKIGFIDYGEAAEKAFSEIESLGKDSDVIIADFGCDKDLLKTAEKAITSLNTNGGSLTWLDHHKWDESAVKKISPMAKVRLSKSDEFCGAELSYLEYMKDDSLSQSLAKVGRDSDIDMWKTSPPSPKYAITQPLADLITYYNYLGRDDENKRNDLLLSIVDKLADAPSDVILSKDTAHPFWDALMEEGYREYKTLESSKLEDCLKKANTFNAGGHSYVMSFADRLLSSTTAGNALLREYDTDVAIVLRDTGVLSFRRNNGTKDVKCDGLAKLFGGGGHEFAAGGRLEYGITDEASKNRAEKEIESRIRSYSQ